GTKAQEWMRSGAAPAARTSLVTYGCHRMYPEARAPMMPERSQRMKGERKPSNGGRAALYARVSSDTQTQEGTIASQLALLRERIEADGYVVEPELCFVDDGVSGSTLVRPALERLRDQAAAGAIDRLYILSPDRLARRHAYQMVLMDELQAGGVEVVFLNHPLGSSPE